MKPSGSPAFYEGKGKTYWIHAMEHHIAVRNNTSDVHTASWIHTKNTAHGEKHPLNKLRAHTHKVHIASTPLNKMLYFGYTRMVAHGKRVK